MQTLVARGGATECNRTEVPLAKREFRFVDCRSDVVDRGTTWARSAWPAPFCPEVHQNEFLVVEDLGREEASEIVTVIVGSPSQLVVSI